MEQIPILAPAAVLVFWSLIVLLLMTAKRFPAFAKAGLKMGETSPLDPGHGNCLRKGEYWWEDFGIRADGDLWPTSGIFLKHLPPVLGTDPVP